MTTPLPKISVITVSFNQGEFIRQTIESVLAQGYPNFEHIIVDGGSTDSTLEILKSYPHLHWTSEPDRGQSHALNKGFARATGEIIVWLNSDDWLADQVFFEIAEQLKDYPIVLGQAAQTDREGNITKVIENPGRSFYDLMRYWIPMAWVAQPSIFFTRAVLEEVRYPDGSYVDEDLYFTMDSDLWLRIAKKYPPIKHINRVLSFFRIYETNKTGAYPNATQRECCRNYRRHVNGLNPIEQRLSYIIPVNQPSDLLNQTIISLTQQTLLDFDILLVDYSENQDDSKKMHRGFIDLVNSVPQITIRYTKSGAATEYAALSTGVQKATAPNIAFLQPGDTISQDATLNAINLFARDPAGVVIPTIQGRKDLAQAFPPKAGVKLGELIRGDFFYPNFFARRIALLEFNTFDEAENPAYSCKELLVRMIFRGWLIQASDQIIISPLTRSYDSESNFIKSNGDQIARRIGITLQTDFQNDTFAETRAQTLDPRPTIEALGHSYDRAPGR